MNILYTINSGTPGGAEQHILDLVRGMVSLKNKVYVWCLPGEIAHWYSEAGAEVITDNRIRLDIDPSYISKLVKFLAKKKIAVIHGHELKAAANSLLAGFLAKTPVRISHVHTPISEWTITSTIKKVFLPLTVIGYSTEVNLIGTKEIALTQSRRKTKLHEGILSSKIEVIPNGLDLQRFDSFFESKGYLREKTRSLYKIPPEAYVFGYLSRLTDEKGHITLIKAFAEFMKGIGNEKVAYLMLAGGGYLEGRLKSEAESLGIGDRVVVTGVFEDDMKLGIYSCFDSFIHPSVAEGFGLVLIEAMYLGLPVVASNIDVFKEVGDDVIAFFEVGDHQDLASKMLALYNREIVFVGSSKKRVENMYSYDEFVKNYENLYSKLLGRSN
ncbi:hypothetical protein A3K34_02965 [candidate division WWE3 bacterium RIFOXYC1_FULL_40_10]|uniref:Glycosyl transferase family 1 domain-containing protein n=1 Tax=candidate division WWE3 bacterium RIFOXYA2_FULL_46_9 TaxID=1802636 RepID=A0A1F4W072_UNCKA|nr:MAG: hypothetical protein A3K58_02965 [candidate division WWE3 bacterium RIFOXYB1_FULL_40_22]OGC61808.1 MAG: hypothetical protein A3K37_02965 [candidate division WWE3 bacterium RIFOXYA1_FULL_40_11]OGC62826.1 MAG: hypothetical protein A2264_04125 [candidate division WWE3 bacterium RIFOXYA2_FULL_46_9]OGC64280.1 MAG: hypothetical protein A2326_00380 [candidate division WWE3 bacterium RIFOXYB2_FULL_41_6]OGC66191.1 MAG: hypothetical protein A3K34_02965 [candidate division WWE3 bacterium RIFOXYC1_